MKIRLELEVERQTASQLVGLLERLARGDEVKLGPFGGPIESDVPTPADACAAQLYEMVDAIEAQVGIR